MANTLLRAFLAFVVAAVAIGVPVARAQVTVLPSTVQDFGIGPSADDELYQPVPLEFGASVGIDGPIAMVGIPGYFAEDAQGNFDPTKRGRVGVFTRSADGSSWTRTGTLAADDLSSNENYFGAALALKGGHVAVASVGALRIFTQTGTSWTQTETLLAQAGSPADYEPPVIMPVLAFDGRYLVVEVQTRVTINITLISLNVYSVNAAGTAQFLGSVTPPIGAGDQAIVSSIALESGTLVVGGGYYDLVANVGHPGVWVYSSVATQPLVPQFLAPADVTPNSQFGASVAIWNQTILVGAPNEDVNIDPVSFIGSSGAVYMFALGSGGWTQTQKIVPGNVGSFGTSVAFNQYGALLSAPYSTNNFATILGETDGYAWQGNQLVYQFSLPFQTGNSLAISGTEGIIGTNMDADQYGEYDYGSILTLKPAASSSAASDSAAK
jgi:hypothetical protein